MKLIRFDDGTGQVRPGILRDGTIRDIQGTDGDGLAGVLETVTRAGSAALDTVEPSTESPIQRDDATIRLPIPSTGRLFALGGVYTQHIRERGQPLNSVPSQWLVPETAVVGPGEPIVVPDRVSESVLPAVELAVVIGRRGSDIEERDAFDHVAGYTIVNDVTARTEWPGPMAYKLLDTFSPCGPHITTADEISQPMRLEMSLDHGGTRICEGSSASMRFTISFIVSYLSTIVELRPGDVISTGDPGRVDGELRDGESVTATVDSVGELTNPVRFE